jgi:citrate synthase
MNYSYWDEQRGKIKSKKGGWRIGEKVECHGLDMMVDVVGKLTYMQLVILNATGRLASKNMADWFESIHICLSWPDSRIWCNRVGSLGGSAGTNAVALVCAGVLAADSTSYGPRTIMSGIDLITRAHRSVGSGINIEDFVATEIKNMGGKPHLMGYARPIVKGDERVVVLEKNSKKLGFEQGEHLKLAYKIEAILDRNYGESMNMNGYISAFVSDQNFSAMEIYRICSVMVSSGVAACGVDSADRINGSFAPLHVEDIIYTGIPSRSIS